MKNKKKSQYRVVAIPSTTVRRTRETKTTTEMNKILARGWLIFLGRNRGKVREAWWSRSYFWSQILAFEEIWMYKLMGNIKRLYNTLVGGDILKDLGKSMTTVTLPEQNFYPLILTFYPSFILSTGIFSIELRRYAQPTKTKTSNNVHNVRHRT